MLAVVLSVGPKICNLLTTPRFFAFSIIWPVTFLYSDDRVSKVELTHHHLCFIHDLQMVVAKEVQQTS